MYETEMKLVKSEIVSKSYKNICLQRKGDNNVKESIFLTASKYYGSGLKIDLVVVVFVVVLVVIKLLSNSSPFVKV